jgi:hypothetical protein
MRHPRAATRRNTNHQRAVMPGNGHVRFGPGPPEKDPTNGHLADGLPEQHGGAEPRAGRLSPGISPSHSN